MKSSSAGLALLVAVCLIGVLHSHGVTMSYDRPLMMYVGVLRDTGFGAFMSDVCLFLARASDVTGRLIFLALAAIPLWRLGMWRSWIWLAGVAVAAMILNAALKQVFEITRPDVVARLEHIVTYSFPSGHASGNIALFGALAMILRSNLIWGAAAVLIFAIGFSRIWLGVHWPTDVFAGWLEGIAILLIARPMMPGELTARINRQ